MKNTFEVTGTKLIVTDPCYEHDAENIIENAKPGTWSGDYDTKVCWGRRVSKLFAEHVSFDGMGHWVSAKFEVGVDSGQAGVFDEARYPRVPEGVDKYDGEDSPFNYSKEGCFYNRACSATHSETDRDVLGGAIDEGFVTRTGHGDGGYTCMYHVNREGQVDAVEITFIEEEQDEEEDDDYFDEEEEDEEEESDTDD